MKNIFDANTLPTESHFAESSSLNAHEIMSLRQSVGWDPDTEERWKSCIKDSLAIISVRNDAKELVGMAVIAGNLRHAVLCDLVVNPNHQRKGIGEAIMHKALDTADRISITYLYSELAESNPFRDKMLQSGFQITGNSLFRINI